MSASLSIVIFVIVLALIFDFINGFHDSANSIATIVSTKVLKPYQAVVWAAFFNFAAIFLFDAQVAKTVGTGIVNTSIVNHTLILSALCGAIIWNLITWWFGLPSSSSHALIGGLIGAGLMRGGFNVLIWQGIIKTASFIIISPLIGLILGLFLMVVVLNLSRHSNVSRSNRIFKKLQLFSAAIYSISHGMNDAQKTMGIIALVLYSGGYLGPTFHIPFWVVVSCYTMLALGTMSGGWRIVKTMGTKITKLQPMGGFCAETAAALSIIGASFAGIPVSTTHTITGAIMGVGSTRRLSAVRWGVAGNIVWAWLLTIPVSGVLSSGIYFLLATLFP
ncbi:MAG: inorganic phosphate transporter [Syntrophales bacterium]|jgi:PiT family inorganic phosphate transporter|nr:inorganic phosphate transporter [Syntrophales bacterium]MDD4339526.1 inorganic phosphate transporter [Syntrophales bacterium]HPB70383.1 inorganic phosphate transporter [Syntrophales bacterium]HQP28499.1 inorganic phosphate transporter [Syntrophales bacterium]